MKVNRVVEQQFIRKNHPLYEIDSYAKQVAMKNYPDIIQCGDAFDLRNDNWTY